MAHARSADLAGFLSTLAQITATVLSLFVATLAAYYVFLQDRETSFDDASAQDKVAISDTLRHVWNVWPPGMFDDPFPSQIATRYRERVHKAGVPLIEQALIDLQSEDSVLEQIVVGVNGKKAPARSWRAPAFLWAFDSALQAITGEDKQQANWSPNGVGDPCNVNVNRSKCVTAVTSLFPTARNGIGFEQWRRTFESLYAKMKPLRGVTVFAGGAYYAGGIDDSRYTGKKTVASVDRVFALLEDVNAKLDDIDKLKDIQQRYALPNRLRLLPITAMALGAGAISGLVLPLALLVWGRKPRLSESRALLGATVVLCSAGFLAFGYDLATAGRGAENYIDKGWVIPIEAQLAEHEKGRENAELLDIDPLRNARADADGIGASPSAIAALDRYLKAVEQYNASTRRLDMTVISSIRKILEPKGMVTTHASGYFSQMTPAMVLDDGTAENYLQAFLKSDSGAFLSISSQQDGSLDVIATEANKKRIKILRSAMRAAKWAALRGGESSSFLEARRTADDESQRLSSALRRAY